MRSWNKLGSLSRIVIALSLVLACLPALAGQAQVELRGTLAYPDGKPAASIKMKIETYPDAAGFYNRKTTEVTTDSSGRYQAKLDPGQAWVNVQHGDYILGEFLPINDTGRHIAEKNLSLIHACVVLGEVTDASTMAPIEDVQVWDVGTRVKTSTNKEGMFKARIPQIPMTLFVSREGYVTQIVRFSAQDIDKLALRVALKPSGTVVGKVIDDKGAPVSGVEVYIIDGPNNFVTATTKSDKDGNYTLRGLDPEARTNLYTSPQDIRELSKTAIFAPGSKEAIVDFTVNIPPVMPRRRVSGKVTRADGSPIIGADVIFGMASNDGARKKTKSGADGEYVLENIRPDMGLLLVQSPGFAPAFTMIPENGDQQIDVSLAQGHTAAGKIVDSAGKPIPNLPIMVCARSRLLWKVNGGLNSPDTYYWLNDRASADENGRFSLTDLPQEGVVLQLYAPGEGSPTDIPIRVDSKVNTIVLHGTRYAAGKALDAKTQRPLHGFTVEWGPYHDGKIVYDTPDGTFKVPFSGDMYAGQKEIKVKVMANGYLSAEKMLAITEGPTADYSNIFSLKKTHPVEGRIMGESGNGIPGAKITVFEKGSIQAYGSPTIIVRGAYQVSAITDKKGRFSIENPQAEVAGIFIEKEGYPVFAREEVIVTTPMDFTLPKPSVLEIRGKTFGAHGRVNLTRVKEHWFLGMPGMALSEDEPTVKADLESGTYVVNVQGNKREASRVVKLPPGGMTILDLDKNQPVRVSGRVIRRGAPVSGIRVLVEGKKEIDGMTGSHTDSSITDSEGRFNIHGDVQGRAQLSCYDRSTQPASKRVNLMLGDNVVDFTLPGGVIKGKVVDAVTGLPLSGETVEAHARYELSTEKSYDYAYEKMPWGRTISWAKTNSDGSFILDGVSGEIIVVVEGERQAQKSIGDPIVVNEGAAVDNMLIKVSEPVEVDLSSLDSKSGERLFGPLSLVSRSGERFFGMGNFQRPEMVPPGAYTLWSEPNDSMHLPTYANVEVKPGKSMKVRLDVARVKQRIVFKFAKAGRLGTSNWIVNTNGEASAEVKRPWIGYSISDAVTGKPVLAGPDGAKWGDYVTLYSGDSVAVPIKPGTYLLDAVLRDSHDYTVASKANLWHVNRKVTVQAGKDLVMNIR